MVMLFQMKTMFPCKKMRLKSEINRIEPRSVKGGNGLGNEMKDMFPCYKNSKKNETEHEGRYKGVKMCKEK